MVLKIKKPSSQVIRQYSVVLIANLSILTSGMSISWPSPMLVKLSDPKDTPLSRLPTDVEISWIVSLGYLLGSVSNIIGAQFLDRIGRKKCIIACTVPKLCMAILLVFATDVWMVLMARTVMAMGDCFVLIALPIYTSEIASKDHRGSAGSLIQVFSSVGTVMTFSIGPFVSYHTFSYMLCGLIAIATFPLFFLPESPYFLYFKGNTNACLNTLLSIRNTETQAKTEIEEYRKSIEEHVHVDKIALLKDRIFLKALSICVLVSIGSQIVGYNAVNFYLQTILISTKTNVMPEIASVVVGLIQVVASLSITYLTAVFERKTLLVTSLVGMLIGMLGLGAFFQVSVPDVEITGFMNYLPIISIILVVFCYNAGIGALLWPTTTELFDGPARSFGTPIGLFFCLVTIFLTAKYFPIMTAAFGAASTYWFFSGSCFVVAILIVIFLPETKNKTFREIQMSLGKKSDVDNKSAC